MFRWQLFHFAVTSGRDESLDVKTGGLPAQNRPRPAEGQEEGAAQELPFRQVYAVLKFEKVIDAGADRSLLTGTTKIGISGSDPARKRNLKTWHQLYSRAEARDTGVERAL